MASRRSSLPLALSLVLASCLCLSVAGQHGQQHSKQQQQHEVQVTQQDSEQPVLPGWYAAAVAEDPQLMQQLQAVPAPDTDASQAEQQQQQQQQDSKRSRYLARLRRRAAACLSTRDDILGPYYLPGAPRRHLNFCPPAANSRQGSWSPLSVTINLYNGCTGEPLTNATGSIQVWQANNQGLYDNARTNSGSCTTCKCRAAVPIVTWSTPNRTNYTTQAGATYSTIYPAQYGTENCLRPSHVHHTFNIQGFQSLTTQMYFKGDPYLGDNDCGCGDYCHSSDPSLQVTVIKNKATWRVYLLPRSLGRLRRSNQ